MMKGRTHYGVRGFTLLEVVIVIGMFVVMMILLMNFFLSYNKSYLFDRALVATASSAGVVMNEVVTYTLQADQVLSSHVFSGTSYASGANTLVLELPAVDASGNILSSTYDYVVIYVANGTVFRTISADATSSRHSGTKRLSDTIYSLGFTYNAVDFTQVSTVTADVQTQSSVKSTTAQTHLTQIIRLRNSSL